MAKDPRMVSYLKLVKQIMNQFQTVRIIQISRRRIGMQILWQH